MNAIDATPGSGRPLTLYGVDLPSRLLLGTARYPSPKVMSDAAIASSAGVLTVSVRREAARGDSGRRFFELIKALGVRVMPNTAGCRTPKEAITTAQMARELFGTDWIKLEVIGNDDTLQPDVFGLVEAAMVLCKEGFKVFPYTTEDLIVAERLLAAGCEVLMPWGAPIGTGRGLANPYALKSLRRYLASVPLIIDAGIGALPLVAIGGITPERADGVKAAGADSLAVITDFFTHSDPDGRVRQWLAWAERVRM